MGTASILLEISETTEIQLKNVEAALKLLVAEEATIPFVARYRKEQTGGLDEVQLRAILESHEEILEREKRRSFVLEQLEKQKQLTPQLKLALEKAPGIKQIEDIYAPYKSKRKTKGQLAQEAGLGPLSSLIEEGLGEDEASKKAEELINPEKDFKDVKSVLTGALSISIEKIAHTIELKETLRELAQKEGLLEASLKKDADPKDPKVNKYRDYFEFSGRLSDLALDKNAHRFLAIRRGVQQKILTAGLGMEEERVIPRMLHLLNLPSFEGATKLQQNILTKAWKNYLSPSLDLEFKASLKKSADESAIAVFGENLKQLLLRPYLGAKPVLGIDPGVRTGLKIAIVNETGAFIEDTVVYPFPPQNKKIESVTVIKALAHKHGIKHIVIGNGTYGRESLELLEKDGLLKEQKIHATLVNEDGASVYSASDIAREEFPDLDATVRGAISIARRFQDPLAELVKIEPKAIGVGQYQHDVNQARLKKSLGAVVEDCVNYVGVDLNTASAPLLSFISGIGPTLAKNVVQHRQKNGPFKKREDLKAVARFGEKQFEQAAGFMRIYGGENPLDETFIHPESYPLLNKWAQEQNIPLADLPRNKELAQKLKQDAGLKEELGEFTLEDVVKSLMAPSQDPREEFTSLDFGQSIRKAQDLVPGQWYPGEISNLTHFGAFVDLGLKEKGLAHISELADHFVESPMKEFKVGQRVKARVLEVDHERGRISLSFKTEIDPSQRPVPRKQQQGSSNRPRPNSSNTQSRKPAPQELKNNPFAALKGMKFK